MSEEQSELETMGLAIGAKIAKRLSVGVISFLRLFESNKEYFDVGLQQSDGDKNDKIELFFHAAFADRSKWYFPPFFLIITVLGLDLCGVITVTTNSQAYGLAVDILGATIVARGLFRGVSGIARDTIKTSTGAQYGGSIYLDTASLSSEARKTVDGFYGTFYLLFGFVLQLLAVSNII